MDVTRAHLGEVLQRAYGITPASVVDAPRGFVAETFDVRATDGRRYFAKLLPLWADPVAALGSLPVLEELHALGIETVSRPVRLPNGGLSAELHERPLIVFDFVAGRSGRTLDYDFEEYVALLTRIHQATALITSPLPHETFLLPWATHFERMFPAVLEGLPATRPQAETQRLMRQHREQIERDWTTLAAVARSCRQARWTPLLTHGDGLGDNVIVGDDGRLHLIDWDGPLRAPAERDTWFFLGAAGQATAAFLHADATRVSAFLPLYQQVLPDYQPDLLHYRFYLFARFFEDLLGYLVNITENLSTEQQLFNLAELEDTCFRWLWPPMRSTDQALDHE